MKNIIFKSFYICFFLIFLTSNICGTTFIFENKQFSFQALRTVGYTFSGGADIGECLSTCNKITDEDLESWYNEWLTTANRVLAMADTYFELGCYESAKECYFRASGYYRTAEFFLHTELNDPRMFKTWVNSRDAFLSGAALADHPILPVKIPFEDTYLPAYLCLVDNSGEKRPMIISHSGFDGTKEELYFSLGNFAVERGYNCLLFEGPGQGEVIREQNIHFRPDWESVVTPVVDYVIELPYVDTEKIILIGYSMGGYLAPRAVAYEHRIKACIANGAVYSMFESASTNFPSNIDEILDDEDASKEFDEGIYEAMKNSIFLKWFCTNGMYTFGAESPSEFFRMMREYTLKGCVDSITCNMLILDSENDNLVQNQAKVLYDSLQCPKEYILFREDEGADEHCQMGAVLISNERIFCWLDSVVGQ